MIRLVAVNRLWIPLAFIGWIAVNLTRETRHISLLTNEHTSKSTTTIAHLELLTSIRNKLKEEDSSLVHSIDTESSNEEDEHQSSSSETFTGTIVTRHTGVDIYENVCVASEETKQLDSDGNRIRYNRIYSYTPDAASIGSTRVLERAEWADWVTKTHGKRLEDWDFDSMGRIVEEETLLVMGLWNNPAHCLNDQVFSIAIDILSRNLSSRHTTTGSYFYPNYFRTGWGRLPKYSRSMDNWCCQFLNMLNIVGRVPVRPPLDKGEPICFRRLVIPHHAAFRLVPDTPLMTKALNMVQSMALNATGLVVDPWKEKDLANDVPILLFDRKGTSDRRILQNSKLIKVLLEERYHAKVTLMQEDWNNVVKQNNVTLQANVYNTFPFVIAPHGAHFTNLLWARQGTRVMEIQCWVPGARQFKNELYLNLPSKEEAKWPHHWYGQESPYEDMQWFYSFSRKLGVEHFVYSEYDGCKENGKLNPGAIPEKIFVDEDRFVSFVASRFHLRPRASKRRRNRHRSEERRI